MMIALTDFYEDYAPQVLLLFHTMAFALCYWQSRNIAVRHTILHSTSLTWKLMMGFFILVCVLLNENFVSLTEKIMIVVSYCKIEFLIFSPLLCIYLPFVMVYAYWQHKNGHSTAPYTFYVWRSAMLAFLLNVILLASALVMPLSS